MARLAGPDRGLMPILHPTLRHALLPVRRYVPLVVLLGLVATALEGFGIGMLIPLIEMATRGAGTAGSLPAPVARVMAFTDGLGIAGRGALIGLSIFALITLKNLVSFGNGSLQAWLYGKCGHEIRHALSNSLLRADPAFCMTVPSERLLNVVSNESWRAADAVAALLSLCVAASATVIFVAFLLILSPHLTLVVVIGLVAMHFAQDGLSRHFLRLGRTVTELNKGLAGRMLHLIGAWRLIRLYGRESPELTRFDTASNAVRLAALRLQLRQVAVGPLIEIAYAALFLAVIYVAYSLGVTFGEAAAFTVLLYRLQPQIRSMQASVAAIRGWTGGLDEVSWLLSTPPQDRQTSPVAGQPDLHRGLSFENVTFRYSDARGVALDKVSFTLPFGEATAIIGRSGSGKSTVANLICGLLTAQDGRVMAGNTDIALLPPAQWLRHVAVASQDLELFDGTVLDNILYGSDSPPSEADAHRAAAEAGADGFIRALPDGYATRVGNRGTELSAGQRQRIALARALLRDPDILILDEATNAMDMLSEATALELVRRRRGRGITIVITHHLSSIRVCDGYLHFDHGALVGEGRAADLTETRMGRMLRVVRG